MGNLLLWVRLSTTQGVVHPTWYVAGGGKDALKVPDCLGSTREVLGQKPAAVVTVEDAREAPLVACKDRRHVMSPAP